MDPTEAFETERPRLLSIATRVLCDRGDAEDVVQQAWMRLAAADTTVIESLPAWLTTVTTRLCLDRLRVRVPLPVEEIDGTGTTSPDPADDVVLAESVGAALHVVLERLTPPERVAFVLHDSFGIEFSTIAAVLDTTPAAARKLASRARAKVQLPAAEDRLAEWEMVDSFMAAAREGDFDRLLQLLAPDAGVTADAAAVIVGTPERIDGRDEVAAFFNGSAHAALAVLTDERPGYAWFDRGTARVLFDFDLAGGLVRSITFRADPGVLSRIVRRSPIHREESP